jgi:hypothetical protein
MFCNYCRQVNPNDAVYCCACGREIGTALDRQKNTDPDGENKSAIEVVPAPSVRIASSTKPNSSAALDSFFSIEELQKFTDEELDELWRAYTRLQVPPSLAVQQEIKRRALLPRQLAPANSATPTPQSNQPNPGKVQLEATQPPVSQPAPIDWMTLLNSETTPQPNKDKSSKVGADASLPPLPRTASPVEGKGQVASPVGVLRDGKNIIVHRGARFPNFCIKCGEPARTNLQKTMYWHPSWLAILIFLGLLPYAIAVLAVRTKMDLTLPLCTLHQEKYKNRRRVSLAILIASIGLLLSCFYLSDVNIPIALGLGLVGLLTAGIIWELASTLLRANLIDAEKGSFRGANEGFMQKCAQRPPLLGS